MTLTKLLALIALVAAMWTLGYVMGRIEEANKHER